MCLSTPSIDLVEIMIDSFLENRGVTHGLREWVVDPDSALTGEERNHQPEHMAIASRAAIERAPDGDPLVDSRRVVIAVVPSPGPRHGASIAGIDENNAGIHGAPLV